jgi:hypothetical protein
MKRTSLLISALLFLITACSLIQRSPESGYGEERDPWKNSKKTSRVERSSDEDVQEKNQSQKTVLRHLENALSTRKEVEQYSKVLPWFKNDAEKIEFLKLPGFEARQQWLQDNDFSSRSQSVTDSMKDLVDAQDIAVGMPEALVKKSWGEPETVEVSGNPQFRNFRWHYNRYVSTPDGYKKERKVVYFEGGKVVGWEVE